MRLRGSKPADTRVTSTGGRVSVYQNRNVLPRSRFARWRSRAFAQGAPLRAMQRSRSDAALCAFAVARSTVIATAAAFDETRVSGRARLRRWQDGPRPCCLRGLPLPCLDWRQTLALHLHLKPVLHRSGVRTRNQRRSIRRPSFFATCPAAFTVLFQDSYSASSLPPRTARPIQST